MPSENLSQRGKPLAEIRRGPTRLTSIGARCPRVELTPPFGRGRRCPKRARAAMFSIPYTINTPLGRTDVRARITAGDAEPFILSELKYAETDAGPMRHLPIANASAPIHGTPCRPRDTSTKNEGVSGQEFFRSPYIVSCDFRSDTGAAQGASPRQIVTSECAACALKQNGRNP